MEKYMNILWSISMTFLTIFIALFVTGFLYGIFINIREYLKIKKWK